MMPEEPRIVWENIEDLVHRRYGVSIHPFKRDLLVTCYRLLQQAYAQNDLPGFEALLLLMDLIVASTVSVME